MSVDCRFRRLHVARCSGLNFNKTKNIRVPADQVNLSPASRRTKVAGDNDIAQSAQVEVSVFFAPRPRPLMLRSRISRDHTMRDPVQTANHSSGYICREHDRAGTESTDSECTE